MAELPFDPTLDDVRRALNLPGFEHEAAWQRMSPRPRLMRRPGDWAGQARRGEVLILLYPGEGTLSFVLTRRTETVATHKGQIALPGGSQEPGDLHPGDAALREACEELGVCRAQVELLGRLAPLYVVVSDFEVHPFVAYTPCRPAFRADPTEVAEVLEMSLRDLLNDACKAEERWQVGGFELDVPFYRLGAYAVWGATAIILSELEQRLRAALSVEP